MKFINRIMLLFKRIKHALQDAALKLRYNEIADADDFWNEDDAKHITEFFGSQTGLKLRARLTNYVLRSAMTATRNYTPFDAGVARGIALSVREIENHFAPSPLRSEDISENQPASVADDLALN